jgi:type VI secretion system secreted protein VgrG
MQFDIRQSLPRVRYSFSCDASPERAWDVRRVELVEELSQPYELTLDLLTDGLDLDADALLVGNGELVLDREIEIRTVCGVITRVEIADPIADAVPVRLVLRPALALLEHRVDTRLWPYETARRAVEAVLDAALIDYGREVDLSHLLDNWRVRAGVAQYQESDLAVVARLLAEDGIAYHFDHERGSGREVLVLENSADHWELVPTPEGDGVVPVIEDRHGQAEVESLQRLTWNRELRPSVASIGSTPPARSARSTSPCTTSRTTTAGSSASSPSCGPALGS